MELQACIALLLTLLLVSVICLMNIFVIDLNFNFFRLGIQFQVLRLKEFCVLLPMEVAEVDCLAQLIDIFFCFNHKRGHLVLNFHLSVLVLINLVTVFCIEFYPKIIQIFVYINAVL